MRPTCVEQPTGEDNDGGILLNWPFWGLLSGSDEGRTFIHSASPVLPVGVSLQQGASLQRAAYLRVRPHCSAVTFGLQTDCTAGAAATAVCVIRCRFQT